MVHHRRASDWLRRHRRRPAAQEPQEPATTSNTILFTPPPAVEELPPYSAVAAPSSDQTPATTTTLTPSEPPPDYQPTDEPLSQPTVQPHHEPAQQQPQLPSPLPPRTFTRAEELAHLNDLFTRFPWRRSWGPPPTTFHHALNRAALIGHHKLILALLDVGAEVRGNKHQAMRSTTPVHEALRGPEPWLAQAFISRLCSAGGEAIELLESQDSVGCTPLHIAAEAGEAEMVRAFVLFHGAEVDAVDNYGRTPLHMAARYGRAEAMEMLLACGADPGRVNERLWMWADGNKQRAEALGSYAIVEMNVREAVERFEEMLGRDLDTGKMVSGKDDDEEGESSSNRPRSRSPAPSHSWRPLIPTEPEPLEDPKASWHNQPEVSRVWPVPLSERLRRQRAIPLDRVAEKLARVYGFEEVEAAQRVLEHLARRSTLQTRSAASSMLFTPEYTTWKNDCETLLRESRKQKEKNWRETGNYLDFPSDNAR